ncbi:hypothetical protein BDF21DRAFT_428599 [Thamnidium elegans]|uniref:Uncharacterized protein n=1 Tax=Thamnidium elegans TaxID=101142 RepID=A0A8H7SKR3_9FUNG|nr:hypothetical protein INT48_009820 [Thamnidium elegans]KAI8063060.1 hypothetical protein BDF21DRAFT_428599 [Thamnidium elegans]
MDNKFQLWSPPLLDLSLDSFSNDLMQEFDKTRTGQAQLKKIDNTTQEQLESLEVNNNNNHRNNSILSSSPIASSVTLPPSEREISFHEQQQEEDSSSTANLFRKSSTFLKKRLSQSGASTLNHKKEENSSISTTTTTNTTNAEDISNIISRQYPPKPLHYSPVVEPPSDILQTINSDNESSFAASSIHTNTLPRSSRDIAPALKSNSGTHQNRMSHPISITSTVTSISANTPVPAPTTNTTNTTANTQSSAPKRRSFFSLRFC